MINVLMATLEQRIKAIEARNSKVEKDKAWETSYFRRVLIILFTYLSIGIYLNVIGVSNPWLSAIVPAAGFTLSTLTLPFFKRLWLERVYPPKTPSHVSRSSSTRV